MQSSKAMMAAVASARRNLAGSVQVLRSNEQLLAWCGEQRQTRKAVHFVPTMGSLHAGHGALIHQAGAPTAPGEGQDSEGLPAVLVSVFVNPTQFGPGEDFECYPRSPESDCALAASAGADAVWLPSVGDVYGDGGTSAPDDGRAVSPPPPYLLDGLCASGRPGHFEGVLSVMWRFLQLVGPDRVVMGEKDYQQLQVVRHFVSALELPTAIDACATAREPDGLALSSRNKRLTARHRAIAPGLYSALRKCASALAAGMPAGEQVSLARSGLLRGGVSSVEYFELRCSDTLQVLDSARSPLARLFAAVHLGDVRLIDNVPILCTHMHTLGDP